MAHVISTINLKGGVGKTTTTAALAEFLSGAFGKRVLVIDLDPQTNLTCVLIGEERWKSLNLQGLTLATLFRDAVRPEGTPARFDLARTVQHEASPIRGIRTLDLLPSSLDLIDVQDRLSSVRPGRFYTDSPIELLRRAVRPILDTYDFVLVDCPPNLGIVTLNGLRISQGYIIPTIPDVLSTFGIPQIQKRVREFGDALGEEIAEVGVVVSKFRSNSTLHRNTVARLRSDPEFEYPAVFDTMVPETNQIASSAEFTRYGTMRQKYGYQGNYDTFLGLTAEFIRRVEAMAWARA